MRGLALTLETLFGVLIGLGLLILFYLFSEFQFLDIIFLAKSNEVFRHNLHLAEVLISDKNLITGSSDFGYNRIVFNDLQLIGSNFEKYGYPNSIASINYVNLETGDTKSFLVKGKSLNPKVEKFFDCLEGGVEKLTFRAKGIGDYNFDGWKDQTIKNCKVEGVEAIASTRFYPVLIKSDRLYVGRIVINLVEVI